MQFTFGLLLYNQQKYVLETLESIKFQIVNYGENIDCDLIINDDCSKDDSLLYAEKWIHENHHLFRSIIVNRLKENQGTVIGQQFIIDNCKTDYFKLLACDDVLGSKNIFECFNELDNKTIKTYLRLELINGNLNINEEVLMKSYYLRIKGYSLSSMRKGCYFHTPSTIYGKDLYYNAGCCDLNSKFRLFEDDPTWYQMIKNTDDLKIVFVDEVIVLYRMSNTSISNSGIKDNPFSKELRQLSLIYELDSTGLEKLYFKSKNSCLPKFLRFDKYIDYINKIRYKAYCTKSEEYSFLIKRIKQIMMREQVHYDMIKNLAKKFEGEYLK